MLRRIGYRFCPILNNLENKYCYAAAAVNASHVIGKMSEHIHCGNGVKLRHKGKGMSIGRFRSPHADDSRDLFIGVSHCTGGVVP